MQISIEILRSKKQILDEILGIDEKGNKGKPRKEVISYNYTLVRH